MNCAGLFLVEKILFFSITVIDVQLYKNKYGIRIFWLKKMGMDKKKLYSWKCHVKAT